MRFLLRVFTLGVFAVFAFWGWTQLEAANGVARWRSFSGSIETTKIERRSGLSTLTITAFRAPSSRLHVETGRLTDTRDWRNATRSVVVINGGYFDEKNRALGLRIGDGERTSKLRQADWGVFYVRDGRARIVHTRDYSGSPRTKQAMQCGPRLVVNGKTTDLKAQWARRSGVGVDRQGRVVFAVSDGEMLFSDWAKLWANELGCPNALNLDGGGSTQISARSGNTRIEVPGFWPVPDVLAFR